MHDDSNWQIFWPPFVRWNLPILRNKSQQISLLSTLQLILMCTASHGTQDCRTIGFRKTHLPQVMGTSVMEMISWWVTGDRNMVLSVTGREWAALVPAAGMSTQIKCLFNKSATCDWSDILKLFVSTRTVSRLTLLDLPSCLFTMFQQVFILLADVSISSSLYCFFRCDKRWRMWCLVCLKCLRR